MNTNPAPTEDTPTNPKVPDSIKGTGYYTPMDLVPEVPAAVQQDDKQLDSKTYSFTVWKDGTIRPNNLEAAQWLDNHANAIAKRKYAKQLARKQLQLVSELEGEAVNEYGLTDCGGVDMGCERICIGHRVVVRSAVPLSVLEQKKQELERLQ